MPIAHLKIEKGVKEKLNTLGVTLHEKKQVIRSYIAQELSCKDISLSGENISLETTFVKEFYSSLIKPIQVEIFCSPFAERVRRQKQITGMIETHIRRELNIPKKIGIKAFLIFTEIGFG